MKPNFHVHTTESDGKLTPREVVQEAIKTNITHLCFTDHFLIPEKIRSWKDRHTDKYYNEIENLKKEFENKIKIFIGAEVDWIEGYEDWMKEQVSKRKYDFLLGSVHFLKHSRSHNNFDPIDNSTELITEMSKEYGGIDNLIKKYFSEIKAMVNYGLIDCIAHFDLIKKHLQDKSILKNFRREIIEILDLVKEKNLSIELNASGWKFGEQYPSEWILKEIQKRKINLMINNDFHSLKYCAIDCDLNKAKNLAKEIGFSSVVIYKNRKIQEINIGDIS